MGHCYDVSKHVTPALAWGFMGTDEELKGLLNDFKVCVCWKLLKFL